MLVKLGRTVFNFSMARMARVTYELRENMHRLALVLVSNDYLLNVVWFCLLMVVPALVLRCSLLL